MAAIPAGNQLKLDGVDDYANIPDNPSLDLGDQEGEDFTIEAFVYVPDETSDAVQVIFYKQNAYRLSINFNAATDDVLIFGVWGSLIGADQLLVSHTVTAGWHHIAAVFDNEYSPSYDRLSIFFDGAMVADSTGDVDYTPGIYNSTNLLSVGANSGAVPWVGWMEEARFSNVVRYSGPYTVPTVPFASDTNTRALWHFDDPACSTSFVDSSGNGNTLTGRNGALTGVQGAPPPTVHFSTNSFTVNEADGSATITVTREGDPLPVVGVNHTTSGGTATGGLDYTDSDGTLAFACGDMEETFSVPIMADSEVEGDETVNLGLDTPTGGASLGTPSAAILTITDYEEVTPPTQPDGLISKKASSGYIGNDLYNTTGSGQTITWKQVRGKSRTFYVRVQNDGEETSDFQLKGSRNPSGATVKYFRGTSSVNITAAMRSPDGYTVTIEPGTFKLIRVKITIRSGAAIGSLKKASVTAIRNGDVDLKDLVRAVVKVVRHL